jgi:predicted transcriptional regulator
MSYGYTLNLVLLNKSASDRLLGVKLGRVCIKYGVPVAEVAECLGVSRQSVYCWFSGKTRPSVHVVARIEKFIIRLEP